MEHEIQTQFTQQEDIQLDDKLSQTDLNSSLSSSSEDEEEIIVWKPKKRNKQQQKRGTSQVCIEGYIEEDDLPTRTKSLTDDDLDELKGCFDLGFGFSYDEIPDLCNTLPALELCYSMSQKFLLDDHREYETGSGGGVVSKGVDCSGSGSDSSSVSGSESSSPVPTWKISSPGDHPEDVKARLKFWAQAVACTVKPCS